MSKPELPADDTELIETIWQEQVRSLEQGSMIPAENFFNRYPDLADRPDQAIDVIFNEFAILSGSHLKRAFPEDFYRRFPKLETQLRKQFELFEAVNEVVIANETSTEESNPHSDLGETSASESDGLKDRFEFQRELGRGATSVVYAAWDHQLQRSVAVKKPHFPTEQSPRKRSRFIQEARAVARLHHPGIIPIHEILELDNNTYLVWALVDGKDLQELMNQRPPDSVQALKWVQQIAEALHYAHENGIVHRDVKPSNIIINAKNQAMLADFGLALDETTRLSITQTGELIGTPAFMAPEQVTSHKRVDCRADIYSLGVLLYYLLSCKLPFEGSFSSVIHRLISEPPDPLRRHNAAIARELEIITSKCLSKDPGQRYQTARALGDDLQRFQNGEVILAKPAGPLVRAFKFAQRKPQLVTAAAISLAALAFAAGSLFQLNNVINQRNRAIDAEKTNRTLLADASSSAGRLAMQRGRLSEAANHFETALAMETSPKPESHLQLVECFLAMGEIDKAARHLNRAMAQSETAATDPVINYWKTELAASGVAEYGDVIHNMQAANFVGLDSAKKNFLQGLNCANSLEALGYFQAAVSEDPYHHSARKLSLIMALSLARFDELLTDVALAQQLYPEDLDFQLIEALALAATDRRQQAIQIIENSSLDADRTDLWIAFCDFVHQKTRRLNVNGNISNNDLRTVAKLVSEFAANYQSLLVERRWRFPPRIALFFDEFAGSGSLEDFFSRRDRTRMAVEIHPEGVLTIIAAESELRDDSVEQLEASRDLFLQATELPAFIQGAQNSAWLGAYATAVKLAFSKRHDVEENTRILVNACRNLNPRSIVNPRDLRIFTITLIESGHPSEAQPFAEQWIACSSMRKQLDDATWHLGIIHKRNREWQKLFELCEERIKAEGWPAEFPPENWIMLQSAAREELGELMNDR